MCPTKLPVIVEKDAKCLDIDDLKNPKFLMPKTFIVGEVMAIIRNRLKLTKDQSLCLLVNDGKDVLQSSSPLPVIFDKYMDKDGFLYILYTGENTYG